MAAPNNAVNGLSMRGRPNATVHLMLEGGFHNIPRSLIDHRLWGKMANNMDRTREGCSCSTLRDCSRWRNLDEKVNSRQANYDPNGLRSDQERATLIWQGRSFAEVSGLPRVKRHTTICWVLHLHLGDRSSRRQGRKSV